jgi:hypothetical protein
MAPPIPPHLLVVFGQVGQRLHGNDPDDPAVIVNKAAQDGDRPRPAAARPSASRS